MKQEDGGRERERERYLELRAGEEEEARQRNLGDLKVETGGRAEEASLHGRDTKGLNFNAIF